jgi:AdoMet-dependent heme synthase
MPHADYTAADFATSPLMFYYEVTRACDLECKHCRANAQTTPHPEELTSAQALALIGQIAAFPRRPTLVLSGGDPLKRADLMELIAAAARLGLAPALTPSATPLATFEAFEAVRAAGVRRLGISLDGADDATHDAFRGIEGSFDRTLQMLDFARRLDLPVQVNTTITRRNVQQIDAIADLLAAKGIAMWAAFFLVPVGRGIEEQRIAPPEYEAVFERLWHHAQRQSYAVKTTEAPHYRRFVLQQGGDPLAGPGGERRAPLGVGDGRGIMFVSHTGEMFPAGFLPVACGRFPRDSVIDVYQNHTTFAALRDPDGFKGHCGVCEYRHVCGGSRARAYALSGDFLQTDPDCTYVPKACEKTPDRQDACPTTPVGQASCLPTACLPVLQEFDPNAEVDIHQRHLPHWRQQGTTYFVTFRLGDSLPQAALRSLQEERRLWLSRHSRPWSHVALAAYRRLFSERIEEYLHAGYGECVLRDANVAAIVAAAMQHFHPERYLLDDYVIMSNHVHAIVTPQASWQLSELLHSWKSFSAKQINRLLKRSGVLWQSEFYDHIVRDDDELIGYRQYIAANPAQAHLREGEYIHYVARRS